MAFSRLRAFTSRYPLVGNMVALSSLYGMADISQQTFSGREEYDYGGPTRMAVMGAAVFAPMYTVWYPRLDKWLPGASPGTIVKKILLDQGFLGAVCGVLFFAVQSAMEGKDRHTIIDDTKNRWPKAYIAGWVYWPIVQGINFIFLPTALRTVYVGTAAFVWTNFMCYLKS